MSKVRCPPSRRRAAARERNLSWSRRLSKQSPEAGSDSGCSVAPVMGTGVPSPGLGGIRIFTMRLVEAASPSLQSGPVNRRVRKALTRQLYLSSCVQSTIRACPVVGHFAEGGTRLDLTALPIRFLTSQAAAELSRCYPFESGLVFKRSGSPRGIFLPLKLLDERNQEKFRGPPVSENSLQS